MEEGSAASPGSWLTAFRLRQSSAAVPTLAAAAADLSPSNHSNNNNNNDRMVNENRRIATTTTEEGMSRAASLPSSVLSSFRAFRTLPVFNAPHFPPSPISSSRRRPVSNDHPEAWRWAMGGHDPATPLAEGLINVHNHAVMWMIIVVGSVLWPLRSRC